MILPYILSTIALLGIVVIWVYALMHIVRYFAGKYNFPLPVRRGLKCYLFLMLRFFGIKHVNTNQFFLLCRNLKNCTTLYFRTFEKGIADFTPTREYAWRFTSTEEARDARAQMAHYLNGLYIEEIITKKQ